MGSRDGTAPNAGRRGPKHRRPDRPTDPQCRDRLGFDGIARGNRGEAIHLKRVSTTRTPDGIAAAEARSKGIGRVVFAPTPGPANDVGERRAVLLALIDDLARLAAELQFEGRLDPSESGRCVGPHAEAKDREI